MCQTLYFRHMVQSLHPSDVGTIFIPVSPMGKLRFKEVK